MVKAMKYLLIRHFSGEARGSEFQLDLEVLPPLKDGEILCEAEYLSIDPYMRTYSARLPLGTVMVGGQVARVLESKHPLYPVGCHVMGYYGWRTHTIVTPNITSDPLHRGATYILPDMGDIPMSVGLGPLGMPGATAYFGFLEICQPKAGDVVVISTAAGSVGSVVGQIAKIKGCMVIGYTSADDRVDWLKELGFDHAFNYRKVDLCSSLRHAAPDGVDCYFDNVGGTFSSIVIMHMNKFGRIAVCGSVASYNDDESAPMMAPAVQGNFVQKQLRMEGFLLNRWMDRYQQALKQLARWIQEGKIQYRETVYEGFENMPRCFLNLLKGDNIGKTIIKA